MKRKRRRHLRKLGGGSTIGQREWFGGGAYGAPPWGLGGHGGPSRYQWRPLAFFAGFIAIAVCIFLVVLAVVD
jgi:hypothetical protein